MNAPTSVQSLDNKKRGRPRRPLLDTVAALQPWAHSRSSLYNCISSAGLVAKAFTLGLLDGGARDATTKRRMATKLVEVSRLFDFGFWDTPEGEAWLHRNWQGLVNVSVDDVRTWVRFHNPKAKAGI